MEKKNVNIYVVVRGDNYDRPFSKSVVMFDGERFSYQQAEEHAENTLAIDCLRYSCDRLSAPHYYTVMLWERAAELVKYYDGTRY